jgi:MtrB/PioB family decaheme-associated outer membrane protein
MKRNIFQLVWLVSLAALIPFAGPLAAQEATGPESATPEAVQPPSPWQVDTFTFDDNGILGGFQFVDVDGDEAKFEEYRTVPSGGFVDSLRFADTNADGSRLFDARAWNVGRIDARYTLKAGLGPVTAFGFYDQIPHLYSVHARPAFTSPSPGELRVPDPVRAAFEALDDTSNGQAGADNPLIPPLGFLYASTFPETTLDVQRNTGGGAANIAILPNWNLRGYYSDEKRDGTKVTSAGSYDRQSIGGSGAAHTGDYFRTPDLELPEPVNYSTQLYGVSMDYSGPSFVVEARADLSTFDNDVPYLMFDNPFRITNLASTAFRQRFAEGISPLPPDNQTEEFTFAGAVRLPLRTSLSGSFSWSNWEQNEAFAPYTLNSAISQAAGFDVTNPANLPVSSLDGKVSINSQNVVLSSRPVDMVTVTGRYRRYDYDDESPEILFPGYAAGSESSWRPNIEGHPIEDIRKDYTRTRWGVETILRPLPILDIDAAYASNDWDRTNRTVDENHEDIWTVGARVRMAQSLFARVGYAYTSRDASTYNPELEFALLRDFDVAVRTQDTYDAQFTWSPIPSLTLGGNVAYVDTDFPESPYGLQSSEYLTGGLDATFAPLPVFGIGAFWARESLDEFMKSIAKDDSIGGTNWLPSNAWNDNTANVINAWGFNLFGDFGNGFHYDVRYSATQGHANFDASNPNGLPTKLFTAIAYPWPEISDNLYTLRVKLSYAITKALTVGARYWYENFQLSDFMTDIMVPYMFERVPQDLVDVRRAYYLDATYGDYTANVGTVYLSYVF